MTTLTITIGEHERRREEGLDRLARREAGEDVDGVGDCRVLDFADDAALARFLTEANLELVRAISRHEPPSMRATAELVGRDVKDVHRNLTTLEALDVVEFVEEGRAKRPVVPYDEIEIDIPLTSGDATDDGTSTVPA